MDRQCLTEVLGMYRSHRCLWDHEQADYQNRDIRNSAYEELLKKYRTINEYACLDSLKKKIEYMRTCFRREYKKVQLSKKYANGPGEVYRPSLWYYDLLVFLADEQILDKFGSPIQRSEYREITGFHSSDTESQIVVYDTEENLSIKTEITEDVPGPLDESEDGTALHLMQHVRPPKNMRSEEKPSSLQAKLSQKKEESQCQTFGKMIGLQLEGLETNQQYIAQKLISDVIFYGRLRKLEMTSSIQLNSPTPNYAVSSSSKSVEFNHLQPCASSTDRINYPLKIEASYELSTSDDDDSPQILHTIK